MLQNLELFISTLSLVSVTVTVSLPPSSLFRVYCALFQKKTLDRSLADAHVQMLFVVLQCREVVSISRPLRMLHHTGDVDASVLCLSSCPPHASSSDASAVASHHVNIVYEIIPCLSCTLPCPDPVFL
jgi:hypothetical protein